MTNKSKIKGTNWEREFVEILKKKLNNIDAKRIAGSGAIGTALGEPLLSGDVVLKFNDIPTTFRIECKTGYGGSTQLTIKKEWLDKIRQEAQNTYSIPALAGKFLGSKSGVKHFIVLDLDSFCEILNLMREEN